MVVWKGRGRHQRADAATSQSRNRPRQAVLKAVRAMSAATHSRWLSVVPRPHSAAGCRSSGFEGGGRGFGLAHRLLAARRLRVATPSGGSVEPSRLGEIGQEWARIAQTLTPALTEMLRRAAERDAHFLRLGNSGWASMTRTRSPEPLMARGRQRQAIGGRLLGPRRARRLSSSATSRSAALAPSGRLRQDRLRGSVGNAMPARRHQIEGRLVSVDAAIVRRRPQRAADIRAER